MKKQLILTKIENNYKLSMKDDEEKHIEIINKVISGEKLFDIFYKDLTEKNEYELKTMLSDKSDRIIFDQLRNLFNKIDTEVNRNCFNEL